MSLEFANTASKPNEQAFGNFNRALEDYIKKLPEGKKQLKFIDLCRNTCAASPAAINKLILDEEANRKRTLSRPVKRLFDRIVNALKDYTDVIGQMVSAQPLPGAIIWGALKVVVESAARCRIMFDSIREQLEGLADHIERITDHYDLYGDSNAIRVLSFNSYTNMIRFWHRVHKECNRTQISRIGHSLTNASSEKLTSIIVDMKKDADRVSREADKCHAQLSVREAAEAQKERVAAGLERSYQSAWRDSQNTQEYFKLCETIRGLLSSNLEFVQDNTNRHDSNIQCLYSDTCNWLTEGKKYIAWRDAEGSVPPILCLSGPPGCGKSMLSSFAISDVERRGEAFAYYFCQFSQPCDNERKLLLLLALQLFTIHFARMLPVDDNLRQQVFHSTTGTCMLMQDLIRVLVKGLGTPTYFFIDGLDEAIGPPGEHVARVLIFLGRLCEESEGQVRLWCSKRQHRSVYCYEKIMDYRHVVLEIEDHTEADVARYLQGKFSTLKARFEADSDEGLSDEDQESIRIAENDLISQANGNFLWAQLMTKDFEGECRVSWVLEMLKSVRGNPPKELDDHYQTIFTQIRRRESEAEPGIRIVSKIIALIAYSRRHLRVQEVRDAVILLTTRGKKKAKDNKLREMPKNVFLPKFTTLVKIDASPGSDWLQDTCRLFHYSVKEFLMNNPTALGEEPWLHITRFTIADACLRYLELPNYSKLLQRKDPAGGDPHAWVDAFGQLMDNPVTRYAAKNWAQHAEEVEINDTIWKGRVARFVESTNFATCMQIQALWVQGKFDVYQAGGQTCLLRTLPDWLIHSPNEDKRRAAPASKFWVDYCTFLYDWRRLLSCGGCHDEQPNCPLRAYRGEVDRIWWAALGPHHPFSSFYSRYTSFMLIDPADLGVWKKERFEALVVLEGQLLNIRLRSWNQNTHSLEFVLEKWNSNDLSAPPNLVGQQIIKVDESSSNWHLYVKGSPRDSFKSVASPTMFSEDGTFLRIGSRLFSLHDDGIYRSVRHPAGPEDHIPSYFEEFAVCGSYIALGNRKYTATTTKLQDKHHDIENLGKDMMRLEMLAYIRDCDSDSDLDLEDDIESDDDEYSSEGDTDIQGRESCSEGSTEAEEDLDSDVSSNEVISSSDTEPSNSSSDDRDGSAESDSGEDLPPLSPAAFLAFHELHSDDEDEFWGAEIGTRLNQANMGHRPGHQDDSKKLILTVFDTSVTGGLPQKVFEYTHSLTFMLYASPPAIHPKKPLLAWPLGAGDVLFADLENKTYFVRKLRLSAKKTRHISVKLHFSPCGGCLHIASLEAQINDLKTDTKCKCRKTPSSSCSKHKVLSELQLHLLLATYRLSSHKTTRSPPSLIHLVKVPLGGYATLTVSPLPFTFTWTTNDLFVAESSVELKVRRIALFPSAKDSAHTVFMPKEKIFLPDTANEREVYFVPSADGTRGCVIVGSKTRAESVSMLADILDMGPQLMQGTAVINRLANLRGRLPPPIGCILHQERDLGGWIRMDDVPVPKTQGAGQLDPRRERFDTVDDCIVEPYLRFV